MAIPLQEEIPADGMMESSLLNQNEFDLGSQSAINSNRQGVKQEGSLIFPSVIDDTPGSEDELQSLKESIYFEDKKKRDTSRFYSSQNKQFNYQSEANVLSDEGSGLSSLLQPLKEDPELKEKAKNTLQAIKNVKDLLTVDQDVSFESSEEETNRLIKKNLYQQEQQKLLIEKGVNNKVSKEKYDPSVFKEFFSKVWHFFLYVALGILFMTLTLRFIKWQRKINKF